jgi:xanthine dehydrogenase molybdopterin-binding subunit B
MLAISVREAIRDAVAAFGSGKGEIILSSPATPEVIWKAIQKRKQARPAETSAETAETVNPR